MLSSLAPLDLEVPFQGFEELPPGIYSLPLEPGLAGAGDAAAGAAAGATAAPKAANEAAAAAGACTPAAAGGPPQGEATAWAQYQRHEWADPAVRRLAAFWRAPELVEPPPPAYPAAVAGADAAVQPAVSLAAAAAAAADAGREAAVQPAQDEEAAAAAAAAGTGGEAAGQPAQGEEAAAAAAGAGGKVDAPEGAAFEQTVDAVLAALQQAVATRCRCIDEGWRQAAAALQQRGQGGGTVEAAAGAPAQQPHSIGRAAGGSAGDGRQPSGAEAGAAGAAPPDASWAGSQEPPGPLPVPLLPPAPVLILFSGGVDSTLLAALAHEALPPDVPIDLASVCFDGGASPDRASALDALAELRQLAPDRQWRLILVSGWPGSVGWPGAVGVCWEKGGRCCVWTAGTRGLLHSQQHRRLARACRRQCAAAAAAGPSAAPACPPPPWPPARWTARWRTSRRRAPACCACWPLLIR